MHHKRLAQVQRRALQVTFVYHLEPAVVVIAEVIPIALPTKSRKVIYSQKVENLKGVVVRGEQ